MLLFNRVATLIIQHPDTPDVVIRGLRIEFTIEKYWGSTMNTGRIIVYNLKPENRRLLVRRKIDAESAPFTTVTLLAGYEGSPALIFRGNLVMGASRRMGPDWITTLEGISGFHQIVSANHTASSTFVTITAFDLILKLLGATDDGNFEGNIAMGQSLQMNFEESEALKLEVIQGNAFSGRVFRTIQEVVGRFGLDISIDDFETLIFRRYEPVDPEKRFTAYLISKDTGLLDSPQITETGITLSALLTHQVSVGRLFRVQSETTKQNDLRDEEIQTFTCVKLTHTGDTRGDTWQSDIVGTWYPENVFPGSKDTVPAPYNLPQLAAPL